MFLFDSTKVHEAEEDGSSNTKPNDALRISKCQDKNSLDLFQELWLLQEINPRWNKYQTSVNLFAKTDQGNLPQQ